MNLKSYLLSLSLLILPGTDSGVFARKPATIKKQGEYKPAGTAETCWNTFAQADLDINMIRARVLVGGDLWWDPVGQVPYFEVPKGSGKNSIYCGSFWIGGLDNAGQIKVAAQTYRQEGANDFWGGPISRSASYGSTGGLTDYRCNEFDRLWKITKKEVKDFINTGVSTEAIREWPGNGNIANDELQYLAPFFDADNNGIYDYTKGDYPYFLLSGDYSRNTSTGKAECNDYLFGDQCIWWVFNDVGGFKRETFSDPIGLEVRSQAFAFKGDNELDYMTFYKYQIINRSGDSLLQTYIGAWTDPDLGNASDDYVACDVGLGLGYVYNGDPDDDGGGGYGLNPPAVGVDFLQGPLADANDGIDNDKNGMTDEPGERIKMSHFLLHRSVNGQADGNPATTDDYYEYMTGRWLDGLHWTFGENGRNQANPPTDYMFSNGTDPAFPGQIWNMMTAGIQPDDMRWLQTAGAFSFAPGGVQNVTTGVIWARATSGGPLASVTKLKLFDQKAQALFDNCFQILEGPDAPDVAIRELDKKIILSLENTRNEKVEQYKVIDPAIPVAVPFDTAAFDTLSNDERSYKFQGYRIYQVADATIAAADIADPSKAKLFAQIDLKDTIGQIINFIFDTNLNGWVPEEKASGAFNNGLTHAFTISQDLFTQKELVNYRPYYFMVVSYAYNNYRAFDANNAAFTQAQPYLEGRNNVKIYSAIPHPQVVENGGTVFNSSIGQSLEIIRIEGQGNGGNVLNLKYSDAELNQLLDTTLNRIQYPVYTAGHGPVNVSVYDPMSVRAGGFKLIYDGVSDENYWYILPDNPEVSFLVNNIVANANNTELIISTNSSLGIEPGDFIQVKDVQGLTSVPDINGFHKVITLNGNDYTIAVSNSSGIYSANSATAFKVLDRSSLEIKVLSTQLYEPGKIEIKASKINGSEPGEYGAANNGFLEASMTFSNPEFVWLTGVTDVDAATKNDSRNWILSGTLANTDVIVPGPVYQDSNSVYENVLGGTWAPFYLANTSSAEAAPRENNPALETAMKSVRYQYLASVDLFITNDKSKWSRCPVLEIGNAGTIGNAARFTKRKSKSIDKNGIAYGEPGANNAEAGLTDTMGMGWFPGYAVNVETGERMNIVYGENSGVDAAENGRDMKWNPSANIIDVNGKASHGGGHYIYIANRDTLPGGNQMYDSGRRLDSLFNASAAINRRHAMRVMSWVNEPLLAPDHSLLESDVMIRLRIARNYRNFIPMQTTAVNSGNPYYKFNVDGSMVATYNVKSAAEDALDLIHVVPNPYYAYSTYENTRQDQMDMRVRITNLPARCKVSIYTLNGTLVRQLQRDSGSDLSAGEAVIEGSDKNQATTLDWDLKNEAGITVASGVYIFHVDAYELGEKIVKWFGVMRESDLDSY